MILSLVMVLSLAACGTEPAPTTTAAPTTAPTEAPAPTTTAKPTEPAPTEPAPTEPAEPVEASVNFEDGNMGFISLYDGRANADASTIELVDWNGSKALKITNGSGKVPYVAFDIWSLLGENAAKVRTIEMTMGIENPDGKFYACSGEVLLWSTDKLSSTAYGWSVYLATKNPKTAVVNLKDYEAFSADVAPIYVVTLNTDNGATAGAANAILYIDDIRFLDAEGNLIAADTSAVFTAPNGFGGAKDMSNLMYLKNTVSLDAMSGIAGGAWGQNGVEMTEEFLTALVPGSVIEIEFNSTSGDMWIVLPDATVGWSRVQMMSATTNNSKTTCQITYEQIVAVVGEDQSQWGARLQCESSGDWTVYSVKVGQDSGLVKTANKTLIDGFACTGAAWGQNGIELTAEQWALLKPGTVIEIEYTSTSGDLWIVLPWAPAGWTRIEMMTANCNGTTCQVTFEQIAAVLGEDVSQWGTMLQCESSGDWEVYSLSICGGAFKGATNLVELEGAACTGTAWGQNGPELTDDQKALLVPGSVIEIKYTSTSGDLWIVMPDAGAGWSRIQQQTAVCDGETCQITFEQIAAVLGDDVAQWFANGNRMQFESSGDWEVYSVSIGMTPGAEAPEEEEPTDPVEPVVPEAPAVPAVPEGSVELFSNGAALTGWQMVTQINTTVWGGTVDPTIVTEGGYFSVYFTGLDVFSVHFCFNGTAWVQLDCEVANATLLDDGTYVATFTAADLLAAYGTDLSGLGAFMVYSNSADTGYAFVTLVTWTPAA